jgi:hypothetical protein
VSEVACEVFHKILFRYFKTRDDLGNPPISESLKENDENNGEQEESLNIMIQIWKKISIEMVLGQLIYKYIVYLITNKQIAAINGP